MISRVHRFLCFAIVLLLSCSAAMAQPVQGTLASLDGQYIDVDKLITDAGNTHKAAMRFGKHLFIGELHNDDLYLTERDVYDIAHRVMDQMGLPAGFFGRVKNDLAEWERTNGPLDWGLICRDALSIAGVIPGNVGTALGLASDALGLYQDSMSGSEFVTSQAGNLGTAALGKLGNATTGAGLLASRAGNVLGKIGNVNNYYSALMAEWHLIDYLTEHHYLDGLLDRHPLEQLMEDLLKEYDFYMTTNVEILKLLESRVTLSGWKFDISAMDLDPDKKLFGGDIPQAWTLECHLEAVAMLSTQKKDPRDYQATYQGILKLTVENNTSWFDRQFKDKVLMSPELPFKDVQQILSTNDETLENTSLGKVISVPNFTVDIISSDGEYSGSYEGDIRKDILFDNMTTSFNLAHLVEMKLEYGAYSQGEMNMSGIHAEEDIKFSFSSTEVNESFDPRLLISNQDNHGVYTTAMRMVDYSGQVTTVRLVNGVQTVVTDPAVYIDLKRPAKMYVAALKKKSIPTPVSMSAPSKPGTKSVGGALTPVAKPNSVAASDSLVLTLPYPDADDFPYVKYLPDYEELPLQWTEWRSNLGSQASAFFAAFGGDVPSEYSWILPKGLTEKDIMDTENGDLHIYLTSYPDSEFDALVSRFKAHGFTNIVSDEVALGYKMWEARNAAGNRQAAVIRTGAGKFQVSIEKCQSDEEVMMEMMKKAGVSNMKEIMKMINK